MERMPKMMENSLEKYDDLYQLFSGAIDENEQNR